MNWTGGKLQRHSKAISNPVVKAQKDYFARARLRNNNKPRVPTLLHISIAAAEDQEEYTHRPGRPKRQRTAAVNELPHSNSNSNRRVSSNSTVHKPIFSEERAHLPSRRSSVHSSPLTLEPKFNTLENVRRSLLKESDWLNLAPARPLKTIIKQAPNLDPVGRRRRVTREDHKRQRHSADYQEVKHNLIKPFVRNLIAVQPIESENASVRIGSNIHQSQAINVNHQSERLSSISSQSLSTEPMLLDIAEAQIPVGPRKDPGPYYLGKEENVDDLPDRQVDGHAVNEDDTLIPLEKARYFESFDQVKAYSSSAKQTRSSSASMQSAKWQAYEGAKANLEDFTSSSLSKARPVSGRGMFSSDHGEHHKKDKPAAIDREPPRYFEYQRDIVMRDIGADLSGSNTLRARHGAYVAASEPLIARRGPGKIAQTSRAYAQLSRVPKATPDTWSGSERENTSCEYERPPYTIERQVILETGLTEHVGHSRRAETGLSGEVSEHPYQGSCGTDGRERSEGRSVPASYITMAERTSSDQNGRRQGSTAEESPAADGKARRQSNENEAWMRDVFSADFHKLQQRFSFAIAPTRAATYRSLPGNVRSRDRNHQGTDKTDPFSHQERLSHSSASPSSSRTIRTADNTTLNIRKDFTPTNRSHPSETDLLTQMSPMTGYLDDRIVNASTYNNAARTVRSFILLPSPSQKRSASTAFGDDSYDQDIETSSFGSRGQKLSSPAMHRIPLVTLHQPPLRANSQYVESPMLCRDEEHSPRSIWRHAKSPSPLQINRTGQKPGSEFRLQDLTTPHRHGMGLQPDYTSIRGSAGQHSIKSHLEGRRVTPQTASSQFSSNFSSPTTASPHRVPLLPRSEVRDQDDRRYAQQHSMNWNVEAGKISSTPADIAKPSSSRFANTPASSSWSGSYHGGTKPAANVHTSEGQTLVFKTPQRPVAQFSHPSRATPGFRFPTPVPLH